MLVSNSEKSVNFPGCRVRKKDYVTWIYKNRDHVTSYEANQSESATLNLHQHLYWAVILDLGWFVSNCVSESTVVSFEMYRSFQNILFFALITVYSWTQRNFQSSFTIATKFGLVIICLNVLPVRITIRRVADECQLKKGKMPSNILPILLLSFIKFSNLIHKLHKYDN
jgi:hypothetical protein